MQWSFDGYTLCNLEWHDIVSDSNTLLLAG